MFRHFAKQFVWPSRGINSLSHNLQTFNYEPTIPVIYVCLMFRVIAWKDCLRLGALRGGFPLFPQLLYPPVVRPINLKTNWLRIPNNTCSIFVLILIFFLLDVVKFYKNVFCRLLAS